MSIFNKITAFSVSIFGVLSILSFSPPVHAALFEGAKGEACKGANLDASNATCSDGASSLEKTISTAVNILTAIVGIAAVIMIIINGLRFITANGDSNSISAARTGIIYALVGLVVAAMAQIIVRFILSRF